MKKGLISIFVVLIMIFSALLVGCDAFESDYERAGKEFDTWIKEDPNTWNDTQKRYYNDFQDWADKNYH